MNFASIGTAWITESFISAARKTDNFNLYGVFSRSKEKGEAFRQKTGAKLSYASLEEIALDKAIDAVYIASPNVCHYGQSKFFLERGKNVICEKPATTTFDEMQELYMIAEKNRLVYMEAIMSIYTKAFKLLKGEIGAIGKIRGAHFEYCQLSSKYPAFIDGKNPNIFNPEMHTGCLMDIGVYNIYLASALFGKPDKISSCCVKLENGCDANGCAVFDYGNIIVSINYSKTGQSYSRSEIIGDNATILISSVSQLTGITKRSKTEKKEIVPEEISRDIIMGYEIAFFRDMCKNKDFGGEEYVFLKNTALNVREACDTIRRQNNFSF